MKDNDFEVKVLKRPQRDEWDSFISSSKEGTPFSLTDYIDITGHRGCYIAAVDGNGSIIGAIAGRVRGEIPVLKHLGRSLWVDSGPVVKCDDADHSKAIKNGLLEKLKGEGKRLGAVQIVSSDQCRETIPGTYTGAGFEPFAFEAFPIDLDRDEDSLFLSLKKDFRRLVRRAREVEGIEALTDVGHDDPGMLDELFRVHKVTFERTTGTESKATMLLKSREHIGKIFERPGFRPRLSVVTMKERVVAGLLLLSCGTKLVAHVAGSDNDLPRGISNLLYWETMRWASGKGYRTLDAGGGPVNPSKDNPSYGVYRFKKGFGVDAIKYYGGNCVLSPFRFRLIRRLMSNRTIVRIAMKVSRGRI